MKTESFDVECLYRAVNEGVLIRPEGWRVWMSDYSLKEATDLLDAGKELAKESDCIFKDCRLVKVTREII